MKVALVYDRVNKWGGAERVLLALHELFPKAPLYTAVYSKEKAHWAEVFPEVIPSFLQKIPFLNKHHELLGTFTPLAFESFDFDKFDVVISVTSEAAKGIITRSDTLHICYCLTPTRYLWSGHDFYFNNPPSMFRFFPSFWNISRPMVNYLKRWDKVAAKRPDFLVAISSEVQKRIKDYYERDSVIIHPPTEVGFFKKGKKEKKNYYLLVSRLIPYKRTDLAVKVFNDLGLPLYIVGTGSEEKRLKKMAKKNIKFFGHVDDNTLKKLYGQAKALVFPQEEDFGIVAVEAMASGTPVIAYKKGGALDTLIEGETGVFFEKQEEAMLEKAVKRLEKTQIDEKKLKKQADKFSKDNFKRKIEDLIKAKSRN